MKTTALFEFVDGVVVIRRDHPAVPAFAEDVRLLCIKHNSPIPDDIVEFALITCEAISVIVRNKEPMPIALFEVAKIVEKFSNMVSHHEQDAVRH
jgi:hypothetical protein